MIDQTMIKHFDEWLDEKVSQQYKDQPLAQHWARISKGSEEHGEAIAEFILATGQNPRKPLDTGAMERLMSELADTALTYIYAIQHFTKDIRETEFYLRSAQTKHYSRMANSE